MKPSARSGIPDPQPGPAAGNAGGVDGATVRVSSATPNQNGLDPLVEKVTKPLKGPWGLITGASGLITALTDLAKPLGPYTLYLFVAALLLALLVFLAARFRPTWATSCKEALLGCLILAGISGTAAALQSASPDIQQSGVLASAVPGMADVQRTLTGLERELARVAVATERAAAAVEQGSANTAQIARSAEQTALVVQGLRRETSEDPRKELANRGIPWEYWKFMNALTMGDLETVRLFAAGGMRLRSVHLDQMARGGLPAENVAVFISYGGLDVRRQCVPTIPSLEPLNSGGHPLPDLTWRTFTQFLVPMVRDGDPRLEPMRRALISACRQPEVLTALDQALLDLRRLRQAQSRNTQPNAHTPDLNETPLIQWRALLAL